METKYWRRARANNARRLCVESLEARRLLAITSPIELQSLQSGQGEDGSIFSGAAAANQMSAVSMIGDLNGDGLDDFAVSSSHASPQGQESGVAHVVFGDRDGFPATFPLASLDGTNGFTFSGANAFDFAGLGIGGNGDFNGDGLDDLLIGVPGFDTQIANIGQALVIFGSSTGFPAVMDVSALDGSNGFVLTGEAENDFSAFRIAAAGDTNGDGFDDIIASAYLADAANIVDSGRGYVIFGNDSFGATVALGGLDGTNGFKLNGEVTLDYAGFGATGAGDINADGLSDILISAYYADPNGQNRAGKVYAVFGSAGLRDPELPLSTLDGTNGFSVSGDQPLEQLGSQVSSAGDFNGDGIDDFLIGAPNASGNNLSRSGNAYLVFGRTSFPANIPADQIGGTFGVFFDGTDAGDALGQSVAPAGDHNGDGYDDIILSAYFADAGNNSRSSAGETYIIFGNPNGLPTGLSLGTLDGSDGYALYGINGSDQSGISASGGGDINGDGFGDVLTSARYGGTAAQGEAYLFYGGDHSDAVTHPGTAADDVLSGNSLANVMVGGLGDDLLIGQGGADVLTGGLGNDVLAVADANFHRVAGGNGQDTLRWDQSNFQIDLAQIADNKLRDIEHIDLAGSGLTLLVSEREVLNLSSHSNTLLVTGDDSDSVPTTNNWLYFGEETIGVVTYDVFRSGQAVLKIDQQIGTNPPLAGDFDFDGDLDCQDIDALINEKLSGNHSAAFDLNLDGFVDISDINNWVLDQKGTRLGDANLDFSVDVTDFIAWNTHKFGSSVSWCSGNFNGDIGIDVSDYSIWTQNRFQIPNPSSAPQPPNSHAFVSAESEDDHTRRNRQRSRIVDLVFAVSADSMESSTRAVATGSGSSVASAQWMPGRMTSWRGGR